MKRSYIAALIGIIIVAFIFGNFAFIKSKTESGASVGAGRSCGNVTVKDGFCIYPNSNFGRLVAEELKARGENVVMLESPTKCNGQFLAVWVEEVNITYTPFFSKGSAKVHFIYSSIGDPSHYLRYKNATDKEKEFIKFIVNKSEVEASGEIIVNDNSKGLMSFMGYQRYLLKQAAATIVNRVQKIALDNIECPNSS